MAWRSSSVIFFALEFNQKIAKTKCKKIDNTIAPKKEFDSVVNGRLKINKSYLAA